MSKLIYLETDEEITDVIDKISKVDEKSVSLVIPRGSTLANSIVNLKLLSKRGKELGKDIALVTNDKIAKNLASQIGLSVFTSVSDAKAGTPEPESSAAAPPAPLSGEIPAEDSEAAGEIEGVKVHQYDRGADETEEAPKHLAEKTEPEAPEVIEAVKDIDEEAEPSDAGAKTASAGDEYKLNKKPLKIHRQEQIVAGEAGKRPLFDKVRFAKKRKKIILASIIGGAAVLILATLYIVLPKAKATISVVSEPFSSSADITINKDVTGSDSTAMTIPGKLVSKEEELEKPFAATGSKNIGEKAKGKITVYNNWDQNPISLPAGTKFSGGGAEFISTAAVTIPGAQVSYSGGQFTIVASGTADVNVEAIDVGEESNIGPADFTITTIPKIQQSKIFGKSTSPMTGGTNNIVKVITDKDLADAKASTEKELKEKIIGEIRAELSENEKLLDSAVAESVISESSSNKTGDQVENFTYKIKIRIEGLTFSENDFKEVLLASAKSKLATDKDIVPASPAGGTNKDESTNFEVVSADVAKGQMTLKGTFSGYIANKYDVSEIKNEIKGKSINRATTKITAHSGVLSVDISTWPRFLRTLPLITRRINIEFNYGSK